MATNNLIVTIQNGARARLQSISLPYSKASVGIANVLLNHGFLHNVTRGTRQGPSPLEFNSSSPGMRRLWIDIKYGNDDRAVLGHAQSVSKPSRRIFLDPSELLRLVTGRRAQFVNPLRLGEIAIVKCRVPKEKKSKSVLAALAESASTSGVEAIAQPADEAVTSEQARRPSDSPLSTELPPWMYDEEWLEAREAVGRGLSGEVIARVG